MLLLSANKFLRYEGDSRVREVVTALLLGGGLDCLNPQMTSLSKGAAPQWQIRWITCGGSRDKAMIGIWSRFDAFFFFWGRTHSPLSPSLSLSLFLSFSPSLSPSLLLSSPSISSPEWMRESTATAAAALPHFPIVSPHATKTKTKIIYGGIQWRRAA